MPGHTRSISAPATWRNCWHLPKTMCVPTAGDRCAHSSANSSVPAKYPVKITRSAESDVDEIWVRIAANSVENAERWVIELEDRIGTGVFVPLDCRPDVGFGRLASGLHNFLKFVDNETSRP